MRVLEAITPSQIGGAEVYVTELCRRLPAMGAEVTLFCPKNRPMVEYAASRGVPAATWKTFGKLDPLTVMRLAKLIRTRPVDVVHTHLSTASLLGAFAARLGGRRSVAHVHGLNTAFCFRCSSAIIAVSEAVKRHLIAQGVPPDRVHVVHNGVDLARYQPVAVSTARERLGWPEKQFVFGVFGRLAGVKGQRTAVEAMFILRRQGADAKLVLAGDGPDMQDLQRSAEALGIAQHVLFPGFVEDIRQMMGACDVIAVPPLKEGFGLAAVEAMALEKPVVASDVGGLPEIVVPGETGFLFAPGDPNALATALAELISDPSKVEQMGKQGRMRVETIFDAETQFRRTFGILGGYAR